MDWIVFACGFVAGAVALAALLTFIGRHPPPVFAINDRVVAFWDYWEGNKMHTAHHEAVVTDVLRMPNGATKYQVQGKDGKCWFLWPNNIAACTAYGDDLPDVS